MLSFIECNKANKTHRSYLIIFTLKDMHQSLLGINSSRKTVVSQFLLVDSLFHLSLVFSFNKLQEEYKWICRLDAINTIMFALYIKPETTFCFIFGMAKMRLWNLTYNWSMSKRGFDYQTFTQSNSRCQCSTILYNLLRYFISCCQLTSIRLWWEAKSTKISGYV